MRYPGIRKRGENSYEINYQVGGVRRTETVRAKSEDDANLIRAQRLNAAKSAPDDALSDTDITLEQAFNSYKESNAKILCDNTIQRSECIFGHFVDFLGKEFPNIQFLKQVTPAVGNAYKDYMLSKTPKTPSGINTDITKLRAIFKVFFGKNFIQSNPFSKVEKIPGNKAKPKEKHLPTDPEVKVILDVSGKDASYCLPTKFLMRTGRRIEETTLYLKKDVVCDVDGKPVMIKVRAEITKTKDSGEILLDDELSDIVHEAMEQHPKVPYLFVNEFGRKIAQNTYRGYLERICKANKISYSSPHCFRYYVVNKLMNAGMNMKDAMAITGHIDIQSFLSYLKSTREGILRALSITKLENPR